MNFDESNLFIQEQIVKINELNQEINNVTSNISLLNKKIHQLNKQVKELGQQRKDIEKSISFEKGDTVYFKNDPLKEKHSIVALLDIDDGDYTLVGLSGYEYACEGDSLVLYKKKNEENRQKKGFMI